MLRNLLALALLGGILVAPSSASARGAEPDGPTYQMPEVGECHQVTLADYTLLGTATQVDCSEKHSALVSAVVVLPEDTEWTRGSDDLEAAQDEYCLPAFYEAIGQSFKVVAKTAFVGKYWYPNASQRSHGARWFRCDVLLAGFSAFLPLPDPLLESSTVPHRLQTCLMVVAETIYASSCEDQYNWHFDKVVKAPPSDSYPKRKVFVKVSKTQCPAAKRDQPWRSLWVSPAMWALGDRTVICYRKA